MTKKVNVFLVRMRVCEHVVRILLLFFALQTRLTNIY